MRVIITILATAAMALLASAELMDPNNMTFIPTNATSYECNHSTYEMHPGQGGIFISDCEKIVTRLFGEDTFQIQASDWKDDGLYPYWIEGSCVFGFVRIGGSNNTVFLGDGDLKLLVNNSINMQHGLYNPGYDTQNSPYMQRVKGIMDCNTSTNETAQIEWAVSVSPNATHLDEPLDNQGRGLAGSGGEDVWTRGT